MSKMHAVSSSDEEDLPDSHQDLSTNVFEEMLEEEKVVKYDFGQLQSSKTLFYQDITEDDEVWLLQCPKTVRLEDIRTEKLNFDSPISSIKCKTAKKKKKFSVYSVPHSSSRINLVLPNLEKKNFSIRTLPVSGQLVFQEKISYEQKSASENYTKEEQVLSVNKVKKGL